MVHSAQSIKQIRKYFINNGHGLTDNEVLDYYSRGRDDFALSSCSTLKEFNSKPKPETIEETRAKISDIEKRYGYSARARLKTEEFWGKPISTYTSEQATEDGFLFDLDLIKWFPPREGVSPLKFVTTNLLAKGYWEYCIHGIVPHGQEGKNDECLSCSVIIESHGKPKLPCLEQRLNIPNLTDLINQSLRIFAKKPEDDWFVSGLIELPTGQKQKIFIVQNETGRFTVMLPEDY